MLKTVATLLRGAVAAAEEDLADRNALALLAQQIRDAAAGIDQGKRALALAIARDEAERKRLEAVRADIADLEERARAALAGGREDLAMEAAQAIAELEAGRASLEEACAVFGREIAELKASTAQSIRRLAELERGRRVAEAAEAVRRLKGRCLRAGSDGSGALAEAEATLKRLRVRQAEEKAAEAALEAMDGQATPAALGERLEAAGFGSRRRPCAADILERLRQAAAPAREPASQA